MGTGINPGFVMDTLVLVLTGVCQHITRIAVTRVANASGARPSLQRKLGLGLTPDIFAEHTAQRHVGVFGLVDSLAFLAYILKWHMDDFKERLVPVIADKPVRLAQGRVAPPRPRVWRDLVPPASGSPGPRCRAVPPVGRPNRSGHDATTPAPSARRSPHRRRRPDDRSAATRCRSSPSPRGVGAPPR